MSETATAEPEPDNMASTHAGPRTLPGLLAGRAGTSPDTAAVQEKRYGIWQPLTWGQLHERVRDFAHGLAALGVERGQTVAVIGDNRPEWLIAEFAAQTLGAVVLGVEPTSGPERLVHLLDRAEARVAVVEGQEQVDELAEVVSRLPALAEVVYYDPHGLEHYTDPSLHEFTAVARHGRDWGRARPDGWLDARLDAVAPHDVAILVANANPQPELVALTHHNLLTAAGQLDGVDPTRGQDRYVCLLPLATAEEQVVGVARALAAGACLSLPEQMSTVRSELREIGPDTVLAPSRFWEVLLAEVQGRLAEAGRLKRAMFAWGYAAGQRAAARQAHRPGVLADLVALRPVRDHLGLLRARRCYTVGPLAPEVLRFFRALGVNVKRIYTKPEAGGIAAVHLDGDVRAGTVGPPLPGTAAELSDGGEILLRGESVFPGYRAAPEATVRVIDAHGWLHTGDLGRWDDSGHLIVLGAPADVLQAADGRYSRTEVEVALRLSRYIGDTVVVGEPGTAGVDAIVAIDPQAVTEWAEQAGHPVGSNAELAATPEVCDLVAAEIGRANRKLPEPVRVRRFVLLDRQFGLEEVAPDRTIRRDGVAAGCAELIEAFATPSPTATTAPHIHDVPRSPAGDGDDPPIWSRR